MKALLPLLYLNLAYSAHLAGHDIAKWAFAALSAIAFMGIANAVYHEVKQERAKR